jgi:hypothetical protein
MFPRFSDDYVYSLELRERISTFVDKAREGLIGATIYGVPLDITNNEHVIAALYLKLSEYDSYHE